MLAALVLAPTACTPKRDSARAAILMAEDRRDPAPAVDLVADGAPDRRRIACLALGRIGDPRDIPLLIECLGDPAPEVRIAAAFGLELLAAPEASGPLREALEDPSPEVRGRAARALARIPDPENAAALARRIRDDTGEPVRQALYGIWRQQDAASLNVVLERAADPDPGIRRAAAYALMRMLGPAGVGGTPVPGGATLDDHALTAAGATVRDLSRDDAERIRELAARALGNPGVLPEAGGGVLGALAADPVWRVRANAFRALHSRGSAAGVSLRSQGLAALGDANPNVRLAALAAWPVWDPDGSAGDAIRAMLEAGEPVFRAAAATALASAGEPGARDRALVLAGDPEPLLRIAAAAVLGSWEDASSTRELRELLADPDPGVAAAALNAIAGRDGAAGVAVEALSRPDFAVRAAAVGLLPAADPSLPRLRAAAEAAREDPQNDVRVAVVRKAAATGSAAGDDLLREIARDDPDWLIRRMAAAALRDRGGADVPEVGPLETGRGVAYYEQVLEASEPAPLVALDTDRGRVVLELFSRDAPLTVRNFLDLVRAGFYDGLTFHRVVPNFVVQAGDPRGDGSGGPGHQIRCELTPLPYDRGTVGMALDGRDTGGSQFFITHTPQPHLEGAYTVFGRVREGMEVVDVLVQGDRIRQASVLGAPQ